LKKVLRIVLILFLTLCAIGGAAIYFLDKPTPKGTNTELADEIAQKVLLATNAAAWEKTRFVKWTFAANHHFLWDKKRKYVQVKWEDNEVLLYTQNLKRSMAFSSGRMLDGDEKSKLIQKAWEFFCNDSFWICAHTKLFDPGTTRYLIDGKQGKHVMVQYSSGGVTPGDTYVWNLDDNFRPVSYEMWVSIIPIGGLEASWSDWTETRTGAWLPNAHSLGPITIAIDDLGTSQSILDLANSDPFAELK
jgi:hypothetical protein